MNCRICGRSDGLFVNILEKENQRYLHQVHKLLPIEISSNESLPKYICHSCIATLNDFDILLDKCKAVQSNSAILTFQGQSKSAEVVKFGENNKHDPFRGTSVSTTEKQQIYEKAKNTANINSYEEKNCENRTKDEMNVQVQQNPSIVNCSGDWKVQKIPKSDMKLYLCNKCSAIFVSEIAINSHVCAPDMSEER